MVPSDAPQLAQSLREGVAALPFFFLVLVVGSGGPSSSVRPPPPPPLPPPMCAAIRDLLPGGVRVREFESVDLTSTAKGQAEMRDLTPPTKR